MTTTCDTWYAHVTHGKHMCHLANKCHTWQSQVIHTRNRWQNCTFDTWQSCVACNTWHVHGCQAHVTQTRNFRGLFILSWFMVEKLINNQNCLNLHKPSEWYTKCFTKGLDCYQICIKNIISSVVQLLLIISTKYNIVKQPTFEPSPCTCMLSSWL